MKTTKYIILGLSSLLIFSGCTSQNIETLIEKPLSFIQPELEGNLEAVTSTSAQAIPLLKLVENAFGEVNVDAGFGKSIKSAVESDPIVIAAKKQYDAELALVEALKSGKDFQVSGAVYSGVEDVSDETAGIAIVLSANRLLFDGGQLDNQISSTELGASAALNGYQATVNDRALNAAKAWVELKRFQALENLITSRLEVLDPLIIQLEKVAAAGVGDVSQVAAAQRTVTLIRVTQTEVSEKLEQARVNFISHFGKLPRDAFYNPEAFSEAIPDSLTQKHILSAPALKAEYAAYQATVAMLNSIEARDNYNIGVEAKLQRPFGGSGYDSDESVGLVFKRILYDGKKLESEIDQAKSQVEAQSNSLNAVYRKGKSIVDGGQKTIESMERAMLLAAQNADNAREEISYLKKQLVIGQSTLDSVLSAEARLYDAESQELNFLANKHMAELTILAALGLLSEVLEID
jgi:outer membrane protein TolC